MPQRGLAVVGLGMVSSVGHDVVTACAAVRAGVARPIPLTAFEPVATVADDHAPIYGHRIVGVTEGFNFIGLWVRLADCAIQNLITYARLAEADATFWRRTAILCVTPFVERRRFVLQEEDDPRQLLATFADILLEVIELPVQAIQTFPGGHVGIVPALDRAQSLLSTGVADRAIIIGVDSLADVHSVQWLAKNDRLKADDRPNGLAPGEAGACVLLETIASVRKRSAIVEALIPEWFLSRPKEEEAPVSTDHHGQVLADAVRRLLAPDQSFGGDIYSDHNGESWRAQEFGNATLRLRPQVAEAVWHFPATSLGDTGAASGLIALCLAVRSLVRQYSRQNRILVTCLSERGHAAAIAIDRS